jgi:hypothetical protein
VKLAIALLLGSAIAVSTAPGAGAAELPSRNAPTSAAKAKTCSVDGEPGIVLPGGDACVRISGSVSAQVSAGSLSRQRTNGEQ